MYLNENLFKELYDYNKKKNIDIEEKYFSQEMILNLIIINLERILFHNLNYLIYYIIYLEQKSIVILYVETFGIK